MYGSGPRYKVVADKRSIYTTPVTRYYEVKSNYINKKAKGIAYISNRQEPNNYSILLILFYCSFFYITSMFRWFLEFNNQQSESDLTSYR